MVKSSAPHCDKFLVISTVAKAAAEADVHWMEIANQVDVEVWRSILPFVPNMNKCSGASTISTR